MTLRDHAYVSSRPRLLPVLAATLVVSIDVLYLVLINGEDEGGIDARVRFVAVALAVAALGGVIGAVWKSGWLAVGALSLSTSILLTWAFLGIFSIGLLIAVPALMMFVSLTQAFDGDSLGQRLLAAAALVAVVAVTIVGLSST